MQWERPETIFARKALTAQGWQDNVLVTMDKTGSISAVQANAKAATPAFDLLLPGIANVHSHAFQRAMVGLTQMAARKGENNFWSWQKVMYGFTHKLTPSHIEAIAQSFYIELLKCGYTGVGEFHYMHNDISGKPYASITELSDRIMAAAKHTGIHLTLLPVMYETANFGGVPAHEGQKRFVHTPDSFLELLSALTKKKVALGVAPHSLRAVKPSTLDTLIEALPDLGLSQCPIHIHIAEQEKEVHDCVTWSNQRPVEWLLSHQSVNEHWCLVHATHITGEETRAIGKSGAIVGLCPTTEADLGDGVFPAEDFIKHAGHFGIGSDSQVSTSPWQELRQLEWAQRLLTRKRTVLCSEHTPSVGRTLFDHASSGGAKALGIRSGKIAPGCRADLIALSTAQDALLADKEQDVILDTLIFGDHPRISDVFVGGHHVITDGHHVLEEKSGKSLRKVMKELCA